MQVKTCSAMVKAAGANDGVDEGVVEAIVAAYNVDSVGDRIIPGAFKATIERRMAKGAPIPFVWSHKSDDPFCHIGVVEAAEERPEGLWVRARLDLDEPLAAKCFKLLKGRRITEMSFSYDEVDARPAAKDDSGAQKDLHELELFECGPTMVGCNRATSLVGVKHDAPVTVNVHTTQTPVEVSPADQASDDLAGKTAEDAADVKAGRVLSRRNHQALTEALATIQRVLASSEVDDGPDSGAEKATPTEPADTDVSQVAVEAAPDTKSAEPAGGAADSRLPTQLDLWLLELEADPF